MCPKCGKDPCECNEILLTAPFDTLGVPPRKIRTVKPPENKESLSVTPRRKKQKIATRSLEDGYEAVDKSEEKLSTSKTINFEHSADILSLAKKLKSVKTDDLKGNALRISDYIREFKHFLNIAKTHLMEGDPVVDLFDELTSALDEIDVDRVERIPINIIKIAALIRKKVQKGGC